MVNKQPQFRDQLINANLQDCRHFNGIMNDCCAAGVNYDQLREGRYSLPCLKSIDNLTKKDPALCGKFQVMTKAEAIVDADAAILRCERTMSAASAAHSDANKKGLRKGTAGRSLMPCPSGCGGTLYYSVSGYNGHMHARCSTKGCVSWME